MGKLDEVKIKLVRESSFETSYKIQSPTDAVRCVRDYMADTDREMVIVIAMKQDGTPIHFNVVSTGTVTEAIIHPREVMKSLVLSNAAKMILVHNHMGSSVYPSSYDIKTTKKMSVVAEAMAIPMLDHVIVCSDSDEIYSFLEQKALPNVNVLDYTDMLFQEDEAELER